MQEGFGITKDNNLLKPLKSKFSGTNKQDTTQPIAGGTQAPQTDGTKPYQQPNPSTTFDKPVKEFKPYNVSKSSVVSGSKPEVSKKKMPPVEEWLSSNNSASPSRPERPQDELFMGVSGSNTRPSPLLENTSALGILQPSPSSDSKIKQKSPRDFIVPVSEVKTGRSDPAMTRKPAEEVQLSKPEQDSREYTLVTARSPVNLSSDSSKRGKTETPAVRVVSGIIERPREIEIQKPSQTDKTTRPSKRENQPYRSAAEKLDTVPSHEHKRNETKHIDSPAGDAAQPLQMADPSSKQETGFDNRSIDQVRRVDNSETRKLAPADSQWPRPPLSDPPFVGSDTTNPSRRIDGKETLTSEGTKLSIPGDPASADADSSNNPGLLGRWTGRGKKDKTTERTKQPLASQSSLVTTATPIDSSFAPSSSAQRPAPQDGPEMGVPAVRSEHLTREITGTSTGPVVETRSNDLLASGATQKAASGILASANSKEKDSSPSLFKSPISASQHDAPAPLFMGGHKSVLEEAALESREGYVPYSPPEVEEQMSAKDRPADRNIADRDMLYTSRAEKSNITSPEMPSQEDFFKQMRQSVMFQNAESIKMDVPELTDTSTKRKSRRNRNFSISGLQPARETVVPDMPTLSNTEQRPAVGGGNSIAYSDVPQAASASWLEPTSFEKSERREIFGADLASDSHIQSSKAKPREEVWSNIQPSASVLGEQLGAESGNSPQMHFGSSQRSPAAGLSPSSMPTRVDEFASPQPSSSGLPSGARVGRTTATEMAQADVPNISTNERKIPDVFFKSATVTEYDHVGGTKQTGLHNSDLKDKSLSPPEPAFSKRGLEQGLDFDRPIPAASRDTEYNEPYEQVQRPRFTEPERMPLYPAPSSAGIFRRPSFGDEEGLQQPMTTHNLPPPESQTDPNIQSFFDGLFKSKKNEDLALGPSNTHLTEKEPTNDNQAEKLANDGSMKGLPGSSQRNSFGADKDSGTQNGIPSSPLPVAGDGQAVRMNSGPSQADPRSPPSFKMTAGAQEPKEALNVSSTPMTTYELGTRDVEHSEAPKEVLTSRSPETTDPLTTGKMAETSSPYSAEVPMLVVEDLSAYPLSQDEGAAASSKSPKPSGEPEQQWEKPRLNDVAIAPRTDHDTLGSFATKYREKEDQVPQTSPGSIQGKDQGRVVASPYTASETNFQDFVNEKTASPGQPEFMVGNSHVNDEYINSDKKRDLHGGIGQTDVSSPVFTMHEDRQKGSDPPSEYGRYLEQGVAPNNFNSPFASHKEPRGVDNHGSSLAQSPEEDKLIARPSKFYDDEPENVESNGYRDHSNSSQYPRSNVGLINSPQESDPGLSDHILSLYDGSESIAPDHQVTGGFPQNAPFSSERQDAWPVMESAHTKSLSDLHSSVTDNRASISSIDPVTAETSNMSAHPSDVKDSWAPERSASRLSTSEPHAGSPPPPMTPTRDPSNRVNFQAENVAQELPKTAGLKDRLRMFFTKPDNTEPGYESPAQHVADSSVHESVQSPEPSHKIMDSHGDNDISTNIASPTFESRTDETGHGRDRASFEGVNLMSPRAENDMDPGFLSPQMVEEVHSSQQAMYPEPYGIHKPQLNEPGKGVSPLRSAYSPEPTPAITAPEQWDSPLPVNHDKEERISPDDDRFSLPASPIVTGDDEGHISHQNGHHMQDMEEFNSQGIPTPRDVKLMPGTSRPESQLPEAINASTSLRGTPDLHDAGHNWSPGPEEEHDIFNSTVDKMDAFEPTSPQVEPMSEAQIRNEHLPSSPQSTTHFASNDDQRDSPMSEAADTRISSTHHLEPEISSPHLGHDVFQSEESPMPEDPTHWADNGMEQNQDRYEMSPRSDRMDTEPANVMARDNSLDLRSPQDEPWNDTPVQTGSFSPAIQDGHHEGDGVIMSSAEPDFDTATAYSNHHDVPDENFTTGHGDTRNDFDDTPNDEFRFEDYENNNHGFGHSGVDGSTFGTDEVRDEVEDFGGNQSPAQDFPGHHDDFNGIDSDDYPADHQLESHESGFDDFEHDRLPAGDFDGRPETFESPRMDNYPTDHQSHEGGFDSFEDDRLPANDFNDRPGTFDDPGMESYPADHQNRKGGSDDFEDNGLPADDFNERLETFESPRIDSFPADHQSHEGGFGDFEDDRLPADDFNDRPETFESPRMDNYPADDLPLNDGGFSDHHGPASDVYQEDMGPTDHYPADRPLSPGGNFEQSGVDNYPVDDFQRHSGAFSGAEMGPADEFPYDTAEPNMSTSDNYGAENYGTDNYDADYADGNHEQYSGPMGEGMPSYEQDYDAGYPSEGGDGFNPGHDDMPYNEAPLSDYGGAQGSGFDQEPEPFADDNFQGDYPQVGPLDDGDFGNDQFAGGEPEFGDHGDGMDFNDNREGDFDEMRGDEFDHQDYGADGDHGFGGDVDHFDGEPGWEGDAEPANFDDGAFGGEGEPFAEDWDGDQMDGGRGLDEGGEYPMTGGEDFPMDGGADYPMDDGADYPIDGGAEYPMDGGEEFPMEGGMEDYPLEGDESRFPDAMEDGDMPMGGEAEEYYMGGEGMQSPGPIDEGEFPMGGEADDYMMGGDGEAEYPMEQMDGGDEFQMDGDEELPIGEMYGEGDRSMEPMEDEGFPMDDGEVSPMMDGEEYPMDQEEGFPMEGEEYPMEQEESLPMEGEDFEGSERGIEDFEADGQFGDDMSGQGSMPEDVEGSDREIEDFDGDGQFGDDMSDHGSMPDEDQGSQFEDGSVDARSLMDEEAGSQIADEDGGSDLSDPFDEEPAGDFDAEDEDLGPSEVEDREIGDEEAEDDPTSLADEEDVDGEEEQDMDDLYEADVPSIPASPTPTDEDRELDHQDDDGQDEEDDIFGEPAPQEDPADLENADPVRLSCLYMQDVGLMSSPSSPIVPQTNDTAEQNEEEEEEEEQPREPVRFSSLYRQSLDWSQALDSSMWENDDESLPEEDEEQQFTAPILEAVPESAKRESREELRMLEVDQEPLTPVATSPLSPRPLETPPPDYDHTNAMEAHQLVEEPEDLYKGADDNGHQQYSVSPRLQPTPPPDQDQSSVNNDSQDDRRDSRGPQTFEEMNLPRRVISPPNTRDDDDLGGPSQASTSTTMPMHNRGRSISQRFSGWWTGGGSSAQVPARPPPLPAPYDSRYGEPSSPA